MVWVLSSVVWHFGGSMKIEEIDVDEHIGKVGRILREYGKE